MVGENIKKFRKQMGFTQKELADRLGCAEITIRQYESNKREPSIEQLGKIADILNLHLFDLIDFTTEMDLLNSYDNAMIEYYKRLGYHIAYENDYLVIRHNGYGYKLPTDSFLSLENNFRLDAEYNIDELLKKYESTKFDL